VLQRVIELGDRKHTVSQEDLPYIIADVLKSPSETLARIEDYHVEGSTGSLPRAEIAVSHRGHVEKAESTGDGGYDALMQALRKAVKAFDVEMPRLADYRVRIPPGGKTGALVETVISWQPKKGSVGGDETFSTIGVDSDQLAAAVIATEKMLNVVLARAARTQRAPSGGGARSSGRARRGGGARGGRSS